MSQQAEIKHIFPLIYGLVAEFLASGEPIVAASVCRMKTVMSGVTEVLYYRLYTVQYTVQYS